MTILEQLIQYAKDCITGEIPSGQKHKWACSRFLNDIQLSYAGNVLSEQFCYVWNEDEAEKIVNWFGYLKHSKGVLSGQYICLTPWQKFSLCQIYGWRNIDTGCKRFTKSFIEVGRKNAKSQMEAGVILYEMATQSVKNKEIYECYCAGTKRDQSKLIFNECNNMLKGSPLRLKFRITRDQITHIKTGSFLKPLCKEDGRNGDGTNPAILVLDEYHQHQTTEFYDLGLGSNTKESLLMIITTAGKDLTYPCYTEEYQHCSRILNPDVDTNEDFYFVDICEIDPEDDIGNENCWLKANPIRMTYEKGIERIREAYQIALDVPEKMIIFLTKMLNVWVQAQENAYMDMAKWKKCQVDKIPWNMQGRSVYVGFDMSSKIDLTSVAFVVPIQSNEIDLSGNPIVKYVCYSHSFMPNRQIMMERKRKDKAPYDIWERDRFITLTNTEVVDQSAVMQYVMNICKENHWNIECLCFDQNNASKIMMDFSNEGFTVEEVYQSHKSLNESSAGYREQVYSRNILYTYNPLLNFAMSNAVIKTNNGMIKIDKDMNKKKIDPVDAMLCAYKLAMYHVFTDTAAAERWLDSDEW